MMRQTARMLAILVVSFAYAGAASAQIDTGFIVGTVRDQSGAVVPGATVTATQDATGVPTTTVTSGSGQYAFPGLKIGTCRSFDCSPGARSGAWSSWPSSSTSSTG